MIKFTGLPKKAICHLAIWQNLSFGQSYHSIQRLKSKRLVCLSFLWLQVFFKGTGGNILHILRALEMPHLATCIIRNISSIYDIHIQRSYAELMMADIIILELRFHEILNQIL